MRRLSSLCRVMHSTWYLTRNEIKLKKFLELHVSLDPLTVDGAKFNLILTDVQLPLMYVTFLKVLC